MNKNNILGKCYYTLKKYSTIVLIIISLNLLSKSYAQQWSVLGNENQIATNATAYTSIAVLGDIPYVVFVEGTSPNGIGKVKKRNATTGLWEQVGNDIATNITYTRIYSDKNNQLYVSYIDVANSSKLAVVTFNTSSQTWQPLLAGNLYVSTGNASYSISQFSSTPRSSLAFDNNNVPYITYSERSTGYTYVKNFSSGAWQTVGGTSVSTDFAVGNSIALDNSDVPFIVYTQQSTLTSTSGVLKSFRLNLSTNLWEDISPVSPVAPGSATTGATSAIRHSSISLDSNNNPIVSYFNTSNSNKSTILKYDKATNTWSYIGVNGTRDAPNNSIVNDIGGNVYNMFSDALSNGGLSNMVRVYKLNKGAASFSELKNATSSRGIDSTGNNDNVARPISIGDLSIAIGNDTSKPFIVYTKTNSSAIKTPIVQMFSRVVTTNAASGITSTSAIVGGNVISDGGSPITERGIVYSTSINPTTANTKIVDGAITTGVFTTTLTSLSIATTYHVRAYIINSTGTVYGNNETFTTLPPNPTSVTVQDNGSTVILNNGIVKATVNKSNASVTSLVYNGLELITGGYNGGSLYWSWNMPNYQNPSGCVYSLTANPQSNNFDYAEIKLHMSWNASASTAAMDVDIYYSLPRNASGLYASATLSHPASYPALPGGEWRMAGYPHPRFDWLSVDSLRNRIMPSSFDMSNAVAVTNAPPEVSRITTGIYTNYYECKYDYSADFGDIDTWGWSSITDKVGLWITAPSKEYYPGGPKKRELMVHGTPVLLNMLGGTHYGTGDETSVAAGEDWKKTFGPFLIYCNKVPTVTPNASIALWNDAKTQALTEKTAWPYVWFTNTDYAKENERGTVTGTLVINDGTTIIADNMWVGLAIPPTGTGTITDFQHWSKNYQFWVKTDANGNFTIPDVLPGTYNLYAFGEKAIGQFSSPNAAIVTAANTTTIGNVIWSPTRVAPTIWQIGTPDRNASEFKHGTDWWQGNYYPNLHWAKFMDYPDEFPTDLNFDAATSNIATAWNYVHPYDKSVFTTSPKWNVNFNITTDPTAGSMASVYVALAANFSAALILNVNGTNVSVPTTGNTFGSNSNAMIRMGIHGAFAETRFNFPASLLHAGSNQISFTLRVTGGANSGEVMYDYIRLEAAGTALVISPIPVRFSSFTAYQKLNGINIDWITESEINCDRFEIEKSIDGLHFNKIGTVKSKGNQTQTLYQWFDAFPYDGYNYYRIKTINLDGKIEHTKIVKVYIGLQASKISIYPSPFTDNKFNIQFNNIEKGLYNIIVRNNLGQKIIEKTFLHFGGSASQIIDVEKECAKGIYYVEIKSSNQSFKQQLIKN